mmetsp:Transcript_68714/g.174567  ORF Transcript_68714/g.174567 Transcript_68714/m.174567 type:complete len:229 (-) Transcript_68714:209-895(-)
MRGQELKLGRRGLVRVLREALSTLHGHRSEDLRPLGGSRGRDVLHHCHGRAIEGAHADGEAPLAILHPQQLALPLALLTLVAQTSDSLHSVGCLGGGSPRARRAAGARGACGDDAGGPARRQGVDARGVLGLRGEGLRGRVDRALVLGRGGVREDALDRDHQPWRVSPHARGDLVWRGPHRERRVAEAAVVGDLEHGGVRLKAHLSAHEGVGHDRFHLRPLQGGPRRF